MSTDPGSRQPVVSEPRLTSRRGSVEAHRSLTPALARDTPGLSQRVEAVRPSRQSRTACGTIPSPSRIWRAHACSRRCPHYGHRAAPARMRHEERETRASRTRQSASMPAGRNGTAWSGSAGSPRSGLKRPFQGPVDLLVNPGSEQTKSVELSCREQVNPLVVAPPQQPFRLGSFRDEVHRPELRRVIDDQLLGFLYEAMVSLICRFERMPRSIRFCCRARLAVILDRDELYTRSLDGSLRRYPVRRAARAKPRAVRRDKVVVIPCSA